MSLHKSWSTQYEQTLNIRSFEAVDRRLTIILAK